MLTEFLLDTVSLETYVDTPSEHLPTLFLQIVVLLTEHCELLSPPQTTRALHLCTKILTRVQPTIVASHSQADLAAADSGKVQHLCVCLDLILSSVSFSVIINDYFMTKKLLFSYLKALSIQHMLL